MCVCVYVRACARVCTRYLCTCDVILQFHNLAICVHILTCINIDSNYIHIYVCVCERERVLFRLNTIAYNHLHPSMAICFSLF
jgi:hypothetical protein